MWLNTLSEGSLYLEKGDYLESRSSIVFFSVSNLKVCTDTVKLYDNCQHSGENYSVSLDSWPHQDRRCTGNCGWARSRPVLLCSACWLRTKVGKPCVYSVCGDAVDRWDDIEQIFVATWNYMEDLGDLNMSLACMLSEMFNYLINFFERLLILQNLSGDSFFSSLWIAVICPFRWLVGSGLMGGVSHHVCFQVLKNWV